jgi:sulfate permease, SulP family
MAIIYFLPKITKAIPASLAAILVVSAIIIGFDIPTKSVGDIASIAGGLPQFHLPQISLNFETLKIIFPYSLIMALVGLMFMVAIGTFEWASLKIFRKVPRIDVMVMVLVTLVTVIFHNLAVAVIAGVVISALAFAWENAKRIRSRKYIDEKGWKHYEIYGPLFFASSTTFSEKFDVLNDPEHVVIDFRESRIVDHSAIEAVNKITERYAKVGKKVHLRHLSEDCRLLLDNASSIIEVNYYEDPHYKLVSDKLGG